MKWLWIGWDQLLPPLRNVQISVVPCSMPASIRFGSKTLPLTVHRPPS